jgi:hypothetical protein
MTGESSPAAVRSGAAPGDADIDGGVVAPTDDATAAASGATHVDAVWLS